MAKEKFNWKGLFINEEENLSSNDPEKVAPSTTASNSFPNSKKSDSKFPAQSPVGAPVSNDVLSTIIEMYESGFDSLNQPGYDFYEFFKAIKAVGSNDASVYKMAMSMAKGVDSKVTKSSLLKQGDFYVQEINKVHKQYQTQGDSKKVKLQNAQKAEKTNLTSEISTLEKQILDMQNQISKKKNQLQSIDSSLINDVSEIEQKIVANDMAKSKILETITTVINGIKNNL
nr:hypothetical protein [uncultured Allomuricauda sp.]